MHDCNILALVKLSIIQIDDMLKKCTWLIQFQFPTVSFQLLSREKSESFCSTCLLMPGKSLKLACNISELRKSKLSIYEIFSCSLCFIKSLNNNKLPPLSYNNQRSIVQNIEWSYSQQY